MAFLSQEPLQKSLATQVIKRISQWSETKLLQFTDFLFQEVTIAKFISISEQFLISAAVLCVPDVYLPSLWTDTQWCAS